MSLARERRGGGGIVSLVAWGRSYRCQLPEQEFGEHGE